VTGEGRTPSPVEWIEEVRVEVTVRLNVRTDAAYFEGLQGRTPLMLAEAAILTGRDNPEHIDGFADFVGDVDIIYTEAAV
jgi:hypothetical protein